MEPLKDTYVSTRNQPLPLMLRKGVPWDTAAKVPLPTDGREVVRPLHPPAAGGHRSRGDLQVSARCLEGPAHEPCPSLICPEASVTIYSDGLEFLPALPAPSPRRTREGRSHFLGRDVDDTVAMGTP